MSSRAASASTRAPWVVGSPAGSSERRGLRTRPCGYQPPVWLRWKFQRASVPELPTHAAATSGYPFGAGHRSGACPRPATDQASSRRGVVPLAGGCMPRMRKVATASSNGVRLLAIVAAANSGEVNRSLSTGTMAVSPSR